MTESPRIAPPTGLHAGWLAWVAGMPARSVSHPWPFPVSATPLGLVRNVVKRTRGKPPGSVVKLRVAVGDVPEVGNVLQLASGRRYRVQTVRGRGMECLVLEPDQVIHGALVLPWFWTSRRGVLDRKEGA